MTTGRNDHELRDRLELLLDPKRNPGRVTGIDFVSVDKLQTTLEVFFLVSPSDLDEPLDEPPDASPPGLARDQIAIRAASGGEPVEVPIASMEWLSTQGVLRLKTAFPGGFSSYRLLIDDSRIDPYFNDVRFSFKAHCESELDCRPPDHVCPPEDLVDFPVDYRARDFWSFRRALLDFASQRYPDWQDRLEADAGVMLAEVMSALGDELAYTQDRVAREAYLETATQRRSLRQHARLLDYRIHDGLAATTWLDVTVASGSVELEAGTDVWAESDDGRQIFFEVGKGLAEIRDGKSYAVDESLNCLTPHIWDEDDTCLPVGVTELTVDGSHSDRLFGEDVEEHWVLLRTDPADPGTPARRWLVRLIDAVKLEDQLLGHDVTRLAWDPVQALPFELDLETLSVRANLVPATAGKTYTARFVIGEDPSKGAAEPAVERRGRDGSVSYLFSLPESDVDPLCFLGDEPRGATPEIELVDISDGPDGEEWKWRPSFLGPSSSLPSEPHFILDDGTWKRVASFPRPDQGELVHRDYASGEGRTVRFGDGELGRVPATGTVFEVTYRLGGGRAANVGAGAVRHFAALDDVEKISNPLVVDGGVDPETLQEIRQLAPQAFRDTALRAVRPEDYAAAAEGLPWVQRAGASVRWTGSWLTTFVTPDPRGVTSLSAARRRQLAGHLDCVRQAGRPVRVVDPRYADLDLEVTVCVEPSAFRGEVRARVLAALVGPGGFFDADRFTFGSALDRSRLEAAIQRLDGVRAVEEIRIRRRGFFESQVLEGSWRPSRSDELIRLENDPDHPEQGSLRLTLEGGA